MKKGLFILLIFCFSLTVFSCSEKDESTDTTTTTTDTTSDTTKLLFVAVGEQGTILTSADGTTWTSVNSITHTYDNGTTVIYQLNDVTYGNGTFVVVSPNGLILTSTDVTSSWTKRTSGTTNDLNGVTYTE